MTVSRFPTLTKLRERGAEIANAWADVLEKTERERGQPLIGVALDQYLTDAMADFRSEARKLIAAGHSTKAARALVESADETFRARLVQMDEAAGIDGRAS